MNKIVKNASEGYGYHYASLADFARQGVPIPKMRITVDEFGEFIEYLDEEKNWQRGARVVVPEMKGCNQAQMYGSAVTYARRFTVALANAIATDDDDEIEKAKPVARKTNNQIDFAEVRKQIKSATTEDEIVKIYQSIPQKLQQYFVDDCAKRKAEL